MAAKLPVKLQSKKTSQGKATSKDKSKLYPTKKVMKAMKKIATEASCKLEWGEG